MSPANDSLPRWNAGMAALHTSCRPRPTSRLVGPHPHGILAGCLRTGALRRDSSSTFRLRDGCSASTWTAPDGSRLLTLDGPSVQTAPDGSRLIVWMIIGMIKAHPTNYRMARQAREVENSRRQGDLLDDELMTSAQLGRPPGQPLRTAAVGGLAFTVLYLVHRILQGTGPGSSAAAAVADYNLAHRSALLASEVAVGLALLAFLPFLAPTGVRHLAGRAGNPCRRGWHQRWRLRRHGLCVHRRRDRPARRGRQQTNLQPYSPSISCKAVLLSSGRSRPWSRRSRWRSSGPAWSGAGSVLPA
jgi:hypothetical protein